MRLFLYHAFRTYLTVMSLLLLAGVLLLSGSEIPQLMAMSLKIKLWIMNDLPMFTLWMNILYASSYCCFVADETLRPYEKGTPPKIRAFILMFGSFMAGLIALFVAASLARKAGDPTLMAQDGALKEFYLYLAYLVSMVLAAFIGYWGGRCLQAHFRNEAQAEAVPHLKEKLLALYASAYVEPVKKVRAHFEALETDWTYESLQEQIAIVEELNVLFRDICTLEDKVQEMDKDYEALRDKFKLQM